MSQETFFSRPVSKEGEGVEKMKTVCRKILIIITAFCMVFAAGNAFAAAFRDQEGPERPQFDDQQHPDRPPREEMIQKLITELGLSEEQVQAMKQNKEQHRKQAEILQKKMRQTHEAVRAEILKETSNEKTLKGLVDQLKAVQAEMVDQRIEGLLTLKEILTPEQFAKFNEKMEQARKKFSQFRQKFRQKIGGYRKGGKEQGDENGERRGPWDE